MKKFIYTLVFLYLFISFPALAQESPEPPVQEENQEVLIGERIEVGCFNIWLHADGKTWQNTDGISGAEEPYEGLDIDNDPSKQKYFRFYTFLAEPNEEWKKKYDNIRVEASVDWFKCSTEEEYLAADGGGKASIDGKEYMPLDFFTFISEVWEGKPYGYELVPHFTKPTVKFFLHNKKYAEDIKQEGQANMVEGWRWYLPIHLKFYGIPKETDIEVVSLSVPKESKPQSSVTIKTVLKNNSKTAIKDVKVQWRADEKVIKEQAINFNKDESKTISFSWKTPDKNSITNISVIADPEFELAEINYDNNFKSKYIRINKFTERDCKDSLEKASWTVTYWIKKDDKWTPKRVTYNESLSATMQINTKQGIPTDPKKPKFEDRESRGSWAIIPYAEELSKKLRKKVDPNTITRAGFGFEVTVVTNYENDWEEKVPAGAAAAGGTYNGPERVVIEFYDTQGYPVKQLAMQRMPESAEGKGKATWQLPYLPPYKMGTGEIVHERKHYTSPEVKDGNYRVLIKVEYAGKNGLYICLEDNVIIWGSMYDDIINVPVPKNYDGDYRPSTRN